ncbi:cryptochrome/photolyase family protein [Pararhizobium haloflavum]|uniref:cryptochrome/photolyase family protein n=1 Tax=Pararhizobium haloflavum TaxID=2037914 RepID=UPI000C18388B|nr:cryptochrome/photolyase family protein [Pararhizobium haloflavum]
MPASSRQAVRSIRFVLGDQLTRDISALQGVDRERDLIVLAEVKEEATYVAHHKKKIAFLFAAMRHFAEQLQQAGHQVRYFRYEEGIPSFDAAIETVVGETKASSLIVTEAGEYRVVQKQRNWAEELPLDVEIRPDDRFFCSHELFDELAGPDPKTLRMEYFYREMRRRTGYLMDGDEPVGGRWNFDHDNRDPLPGDVSPPNRPHYGQDDTTKEVIELVASTFGEHFGELEPFDYPVTRRQALHYLNWFIAEALPDFGRYQDAMRQGEPLMFHSHLSALINCGLLSARECCDRVEAAHKNGSVPINAAEGFLRQIIGWREFIRGVYWLKMPGYGDQNALSADRQLPEFFWSADTDMNCLAQAIGETSRNAYAHHIQRLMVIGNFCLLAGLDPREVQEWYLLVYHDAYEWVEMPNVVGMILYADDGFFASKPYAASGAYINRMSDYCGNCRYDVKRKNGPDACPFNYLYWDFVMRNRAHFERNRRMGVVLKSLDRMSSDKKDAVRSDSERFLSIL